MPDTKKYDIENKDENLKMADAEKSDSSGKIPEKVHDLLGERLIGDMTGGKSVKEKRKKRVSLVLDIIVAVLLLAIVVGAVFGSYYLFRIYSNDYDTASIKYTFAFTYVGGGDPMVMPGQELYYTSGGNSYYFGRIISAEKIELDGADENAYAFTVSVDAKYRADAGYSVNNFRLAVGSEYTLRSNMTYIKGTIVELTRAN